MPDLQDGREDERGHGGRRFLVDGASAKRLGQLSRLDDMCIFYYLVTIYGYVI